MVAPDILGSLWLRVTLGLVDGFLVQRVIHAIEDVVYLFSW